MHATSKVVSALAAAVCLLAGCASMEEDWETNKKLDNPHLYNNFVRMYPDSPHVAEARQRRDASVERAYAQAKATNTRESYQRFMDTHRGFPRVADAIEDMSWLDTKGATDRWALGTYLRKYPQGRYAAEGRPAYERLRAPLLADASWESGKAASGCNWVCRGTKNCTDAGAPGLLLVKTLGYASMKTDVPAGTLFQHVGNDMLPDGKPIVCQHSRRTGAEPVHFSMCRQLDPPVSMSYEHSDDPAKAVFQWRRLTVEPSEIKSWQRDCG